MNEDAFTTAISRHIWDTKYRYRKGEQAIDEDIEATWQRVARALAAMESSNPHGWEERFLEVLRGFGFVPGGRILAGAGTDRRVTLFNCFVMGIIEDSIDGIFDALKQGALTMQQGGGVGYDFSTLRPKGTPAQAVGTIASGPVSFMRIWDSMCATLLSTGARRGAMMATLRCDHPDIEAFVAAKRDPRELRHFNLSVQATDAFMEAVRDDREWDLVFPADDPASGETIVRDWPGRPGPVPCQVYRKVRARSLWESIMHSTYEYAEPGVLFIDRINEYNNLWYRERISATNPCGEIPLPPYGACDLGSINLTQFVERPFSEQARFDLDGVQRTAATAVRMLDDVIDGSRYPLEQQAEQARGTRRVGLGLTGLADALIMLGMTYGDEKSLRFAAEVMQTICHSAYRTSIDLAREKGPFPFFDRESYLQGRFVSDLPEDIREEIRKHGIRNSHLTAIAPTGTISLLANNVSSGVEPVFDFHFTRRVLELDGTYTTYTLTDYAHQRWSETNGSGEPLPEQFVDALELDPETHLNMQAALQPFVDNAISKTINVPEHYDLDAFKSLYELAYEKGLKGCTTFRPNPVTGQILEADTGAAGAHCCSIEREAD